MEVIIRPVQDNELFQLRDFALETFITAFAKYNTEEDMQAYLNESLSQESIREQFENQDSHFAFALEENNLVGYLKLNAGKAQTDSVLENAIEIERIYVHEDYQGRKVGNLLLNYTLEKAREMKIDWIWLGVWEKNEGAIRFYKRAGFEQFGKHHFMLGKDIQTDILMKSSVS